MPVINEFIKDGFHKDFNDAMKELERMGNIKIIYTGKRQIQFVDCVNITIKKMITTILAFTDKMYFSVDMLPIIKIVPCQFLAYSLAFRLNIDVSTVEKYIHRYMADMSC